MLAERPTYLPSFHSFLHSFGDVETNEIIRNIFLSPWSSHVVLIRVLSGRGQNSAAGEGLLRDIRKLREMFRGLEALVSSFQD